MPTFLLWSDAGDCLWLALRLQREGHRVAFHVDDPHAQDVGKGLVPLAPHPELTGDTVVIFDSSGHGLIGQALRYAGYPVIGGNPLDVRLELDRPAATAIFQNAGLAVPDTKAFTDVDQALAFLENNADGTFFLKPSENISTALSYGADASKLARFLRWARPLLAHTSSFLLQRQVEGTEVSTELWFDGTRFVSGSASGTVEEKRLGTGNTGPRTGCQSNIVWPWSDEAPLIGLTVAKLLPLLAQYGFVGPIDLNAIITPDGIPVILEASPRIGCDAFQALSLLIPEDLGLVLEAFARGGLDRFPIRQDLMAMTLRVSTPPFPAETVEGAATMRGLPLDPGLTTTPYFFPDDVMLGDDGLPALAGRDGNIGCFGELGLLPPLMRRELVRQAKAMGQPEYRHYRLDPVANVEQVWGELRRLGYLREWDLPASALDLGPLLAAA